MYVCVRAANLPVGEAAGLQGHSAREERLRLSLEVAGACSWELNPATGVTTWDASAVALLGVPASAGLEDALAYYVHPADLGGVLVAVASALDPAGSGRYATEHRDSSDGGGRGAFHPAGGRWLESLGQAWFEGEGAARRAVRLVCITVDVTERRAAAERQGLLVAELNHRVKNTLSVVQSIAEQTRRSSEGTPGGYERPPGAPERRRFHADFQARLRALATAHDALTRETWRSAPLGDLVQKLVAPYASRTAAPPSTGTSVRVLVGGPSIWLGPETAVAFALVVHELATNAAKHGALSSPGGQVSASWGADAATGAVWLRWAETGGPPVPGPPARSGFGSRLIEATVRRQLGGSVAWLWGARGLVVDLAVPAARALA
ncbi:MAG: domain S-box protein [Rhodospirillales bacterium]|jgi:two-component sensor histidine kinase|nr:domain S-box protein [Rhodospirillales bacterium]